MMQKKIVGLLAVLLLAVSVAGAETVQAESTVKAMVDEVLASLAQEGQATDEKMDAIIGIISPVFDFPLMAKLTLGKTYWPRLNKDQQQEFTDLFVKKLRTVYTKQVDGFSGQKVVFGEARQVKSHVYLDSYVLSKGDRISILYKLYKAGDVWRIFDMEIQGVSMKKSYNAQFVPIIRDRSVEALLQDLRKNLNEENS